MQDFWRFAGTAVGMAVIALTLRGGHRPIGMAVSMLAGAALLLTLATPLREAADTLRALADGAHLPQGNTALILRMLGVSVAAEFAAQTCRDAQEESLALRVELAARVLLLSLAAPLLRQVAQLILELTA